MEQVRAAEDRVLNRYIHLLIYYPVVTSGSEDIELDRVPANVPYKIRVLSPFEQKTSVAIPQDHRPVFTSDC